ncbi:hypothetical protein [Xanthomonas phage BUDD]|nr:hypothetical protein [Xanthomonas phage BUDD]
MANSLYAKARQRFLEGAINWNTDTIRALLVDSGTYTVNLATHEFVTSIPAGARVAGPITLTAKTTTDGAADAADAVFPTVSGASIEAVVLYKDTGTEATSPLIAYIDIASGLPVTPNSGDINVVWDNGSNKIFRL